MKIYPFLFFYCCQILFSQSFTITKIEPPNWWTEMKWDTLQLMVYGENLNGIAASSPDTALTVLRTHSAQGGKYCFIDLLLEKNVESRSYQIRLSRKNSKKDIIYPIFERNTADNRCQGFNEEDIIYLITPDRWVNGDLSNDRIPGMRDQRDPHDILGRHGGDIAGIIKKLPYLKDLGITAIWINPLLQNDMEISYHGYAATDLYLIDPRFGSNELYQELVRKAHRHGIKVIMDHVSNHIGKHHLWIKYAPSDDWFNGSVSEHDISPHEKEILFDIHSDTVQIQKLRNGWFADVMPDLNQKNPFLSNYLIQNTLWWIEYTGLDGIREDTFPYVEPSFLAKLKAAIQNDYPEMSIVGEVWIHDPVFLAPYQEGSLLARDNPAVLKSITDFGLFEAFSQTFFHSRGVSPLYSFISRDFIYADARKLLTFLDNHDVLRFMDVVQGDIPRYIMGLSILLTTRGIPQIYYGTEIGLAGGGGDHGQIRAEFPGGFPHHERDAFKEAERTRTENLIFTRLQNLIYIRRSNIEFSRGNLLHFPPHENIYVYFRSFENNKSMVIVNGNDYPLKFQVNDYYEYIKEAKILGNLITNNSITLNKSAIIPLEPFEVQILKLKH